MYIVKGFLASDALVNNSPNIVSQFGEISTYSETFARNKGYYTDSNYPGIRLTSFINLDNDQNQMLLNAEVVNHLTHMGDYLFGRYQLGNIGSSVNTLISEIQTEFTGDRLLITSVAITSLVSDNLQSSKRLPEQMRWQAVDTLNTNRIFEFTFWFGDEYFRNLYTDYEIIAVPTIPNVDGFYASQTELSAALAQVTVKNTIARIDAAAGSYPYTTVVTRTLQWREHPNFGSASRDVDWNFVVYGPAGTAIEATNQAVQDYLSNPANTAVAVSDWQQIFPGAFETSEYFIIPMWHRVVSAVPTPIYSPTLKPSTLIGLMILNTPMTAPVEWWNTYASITTSLYQSIDVGIIGSNTNSVNNDFDFAIKYSDYLNVSLSHPDAGRMSPSTQGFVSMLTELIRIGEYLTSTTTTNQIPAGYTRIIRNNKIFITTSYEDTRYFLLSKSSFTTS